MMFATARPFVCKAVGALSVSIAAASAHGAAIELDLAGLGFYEMGNVVTALGFRISPACHFDVGNSPGGPWISSDQTRCPPYNNAYLGAHPGSDYVYIDRLGDTFSLRSFAFSARGTSLTSSKGGSVTFGRDIDPSLELWDYTTSWPSIILNGPEWQGIQWIEFRGGSAGDPLNQIANVLMDVPEPGPVALVLAALLAFALTRRLKA